MRDLLLYFGDVIRNLIRGLPGADLVEPPDIEERDEQRGRLSLRLRFPDGSTLSLRLWADCSGDWPRWRTYSFHYSAADGSLRFRYDDTAHYPTLAGFPHHLHLQTGEVAPEDPPTLRTLIERIRPYLTGG